MKFVTDEMQQQLQKRLEQLKKEHPNAQHIDVWWDGDSFFGTDKPKMKYKITEMNT